ncbi:MAG: adenylate/guanylate cyclase domain-containing protein [Bacteroidota bacterium]
MTTEQKVIRKLSAILSADVKGYSRLMSEDEAHTIKTIKEYRKIITTIVNDHSGRVVDAPGDNIMAEFSSVVNAVQSSVDIQNALKEKNAELPDDKRLVFRIGVNIGDVVQDGDSLYGDGVNIAARIEGLADPGGVCISKNAYNHIHNKLNFGYEYLGDHSVKNIKQSVRVYKILMDQKDAGKLIGKKPKSLVGKWLWSAIVVAAIIITSMVWLNFKENPAISEIPSIAVLPFDNLSDDPEQGYLSDGLTDELIGDLAKIDDIFVISRNSTFTYKGKAVKIRQVAKELNVRYVLEGSFQRSGKKVRIRAQLIDGKTDHHIWSESYDGVMDDIFELQDEITGKIVAALAITLSADEKERISDKGTDNILAYEKYLKGLELYTKHTPESVLESEKYYLQALELDPNFTRASAGLAMTYIVLSTNKFSKFFNKNQVDRTTYHFKARHFVEQAMEHPTWEAYRVSAYLDVEMRHYDKALSYAEKAYALAPNESLTNLTLGVILVWHVRAEEALPYIEKSIKLDPHFFETQALYKALAHFTMGNYQQSIDVLRYTLTLNPDFSWLKLLLAASYGLLDQEKEAANTLEDYLKKRISTIPLSANLFYYVYPWKDHKIFDHFFEGLVKAGFKGNPKYYKISKQDRLNGKEINNLFLGRTMIIDNQMIWKISKNGDVEFPTGSGPNDPVLKGKTWIENDTSCFQFEQLFGGIKFCSEMYRNTEADTNSQSAYMALNDSILNSITIQQLK